MNNISSAKEKENIDTIKKKLAYMVPIFGSKLRNEFKKFGIKTIFTSGHNLRNLICMNKSKLLPNSFPDVFQLNCTCNALYIGKAKKKVITRTMEHLQDSFHRVWESSGPTEHCLERNGQFKWTNYKTLSTEKQYHRRKIREPLEFKKPKTNKRRKVLNRDEGNLVRTNT